MEKQIQLYEEERILRDATLERQVKQLGDNCCWLIAQMDRIHTALCPGITGTWQDRVKQTVIAAEKISKEQQ